MKLPSWTQSEQSESQAFNSTCEELFLALYGEGANEPLTICGLHMTQSNGWF